MRIVNQEEFLKLPANTLFSYYTPQVFDELEIKCCSPEYGWKNDYLHDTIIGAIENDSSTDLNEKVRIMEMGGSVESDFEYTGRNGMFEPSTMYLIYEKKDVVKLIDRLKKCL